MDKLNLGDWSSAIQIAQVIIMVASVAIIAWLKTQFVPRTEHAETIQKVALLETQLDMMKTENAALSQAQKMLATKDDISRIEIAIQAADGDRKALAANIKGISDVLTRITTPLDMLMEEGLRARRS